MLPFASRQMANVIRCNGLQRLQLKLVDSTNYTSRDQQCLYSQSLFTKMFDFPLKFNRKVKDDNSNQDKSVISDDVTQVPQKETESNESKVVYQQNQTVEEQLNTTKNDDEHCAIKNSQSSENQITSIINTIKKAPNIESSTLAHSLNSNCTEYDDLKSSANDGINSNEHSLRQQLSLIASIFTNDSESLMQLMLNYPCLLAIQRQATEDLIQLLQSIGLTRQHVADNPWIFCLKLSSFEEKIWTIKLVKEKRSSDLDFVYIIPLLNLSPTSLRSYLLKYVNQKQPLPFCLDWKDRVRFMCEHLEIIPQTCHQLFEEHQILLTKPLKDLREMVLLLKNEGKVNAKELLQDIWVLRHNYYRIKSRIQKTNELQIDFRPWMGRCNERSFEIRCERQVLQKSILGGRTLSQFISDRLNVPQSDVQRLIIDTDKIESVSIEKLDKVFDVLLQQNVNCDTIVRNIKMVEFSPETLIKRIGQVRRVFGNDDYINLITLDRRNYEKRFLATARRHSLGQQAKAELIEDLSKC